MLWFKNKKNDNEAEELDEIDLILKELELDNLNVLIKRATELANEKDKADIKKVLEYLKPFMIEALSKGDKSGRSPELPELNFPYYIPYNFAVALKRKGIEISTQSGKYSDLTKPIYPEEGLKKQYTPSYQPLPIKERTLYISFSLAEVKK